MNWGKVNGAASVDVWVRGALHRDHLLPGDLAATATAAATTLLVLATLRQHYYCDYPHTHTLCALMLVPPTATADYHNYRPLPPSLTDWSIHSSCLPPSAPLSVAFQPAVFENGGHPNPLLLPGDDSREEPTDQPDSHYSEPRWLRCRHHSIERYTSIGGGGGVTPKIEEWVSVRICDEGWEVAILMVFIILLSAPSSSRLHTARSNTDAAVRDAHAACIG